MNRLIESAIVLLCLTLSGCASQDVIILDGGAKKYSCLKPKHKTIIAMHWDTCPLLGWNPRHAMLNQKWVVVPIISIENEKYYRAQKNLQHKLNKEVRDCSLPSKISEIIDLNANTEIHVDEMFKYSNPSYRGVKFEGSITLYGKTYNVGFRESMNESTNITGYNIDDYFETCDNDL
ncbi:MAG: hypothetical protein ACI9IA_002347 [Enterobacterales bacterium]|jgi:hypothetical protein